ncbi:MAG TPA: phosphatidylglycerol lysyltransferase domain-containing protein [Syntrophorhabdaceae bacterium]|nr:phosphatidylglycerol lysyltransferase domain-containing protein [Syntrophorhabdaceae bacterium]
MQNPQFPDFKPIGLEDREFIDGLLSADNPTISEMTFTNLFIWRRHYAFQWSIYKDWLFIISGQGQGGVYAFEPIGSSPRKEAVFTLLTWLRDTMQVEDARIERADQKLISELSDLPDFSIEPLRDHFDYVYRREDLVQLAGNKYRSKRNHINQLLRFHACVYEPLQGRHIDDCLELQEKWCQMRRCEDDLSLLSEHEAIVEILTHFDALQVQGGVGLVGGKLGAFTIGEQLNSDTAVIHIEKADPEMSGLYSFINQQFCENVWQHVTYINREQDLGIPGLREAKLSYYPDHFSEKFRIRLK